MSRKVSGKKNNKIEQSLSENVFDYTQFAVKTPSNDKISVIRFPFLLKNEDLMLTNVNN